MDTAATACIQPIDIIFNISVAQLSFVQDMSSGTSILTDIALSVRTPALVPIFRCIDIQREMSTEQCCIHVVIASHLLYTYLRYYGLNRSLHVDTARRSKNPRLSFPDSICSSVMCYPMIVLTIIRLHSV